MYCLIMRLLNNIISNYDPSSLYLLNKEMAKDRMLGDKIVREGALKRVNAEAWMCDLDKVM